jgi:hypothetical protein
MKLMLDSWLKSSTLLSIAFFTYVAAALIMFTFLVPPFQKPDEQTHFQSAVSITNLDLICGKDSEGEFFYPLKRKYADLPELMHIWDVWDLGADYRRRFEVDWLRMDFSDPMYDEEVRIYGPCNKPLIGDLSNAHGPFAGYLPNAAGILVGKPFESPLVSFYLGRIFGGLFFILAIAISLRLTPQRFTPAVYLYAAIPTVLHQVTAISYDAVQLSLFPVIFATLTNLVDGGRQISRWQLLGFMALLIWMISTRIISYFPLVLLIFALKPSQIASSFSRYAAITSAFIGVAALLTVVYSLVYLPRVGYQLEEDTGINAVEQAKLILDQPGRFLSASYETLFARGDWLVRQGIATFGWGDTGLPQVFYYVIVFIAAFVFYQIIQRDSPMLTYPQIASLIGALLLVGGVLFLSLYLVATPVGSGVIDGLQGRYFIGLLPFAAFGLSQLAVRMGKRVFAGVLMGGMVAVFFYNTFGTIYARFYDEPFARTESLDQATVTPLPGLVQTQAAGIPVATSTPAVTMTPTQATTQTAAGATAVPTDTPVPSTLVATPGRTPTPSLPISGSGGFIGK